MGKNDMKIMFRLVAADGANVILDKQPITYMQSNIASSKYVDGAIKSPKYVEDFKCP